MIDAQELRRQYLDLLLKAKCEKKEMIREEAVRAFEWIKEIMAENVKKGVIWPCSLFKFKKDNELILRYVERENDRFPLTPNLCDEKTFFTELKRVVEANVGFKAFYEPEAIYENHGIGASFDVFIE